MRKVPQLTAYFWIIKVLTTAMGEATSDYLVHRFPPVVAVLLGFVALVAALALQFAVRRYLACVYWLAVVMVAVFGTMAADTLHIHFGVPYAVSTSLFAVVLAVVLVVWFRTEKTLSIHSINTPRREAFYWAAVIAAFALGTAAGDMSATTFHLGYFWSAMMYSGLLVLPALAYRLGRMNEIGLFWVAYVLTRPVGASFADWIDKPHSIGGLNSGNGPLALVLTGVIIALVAYLAVSRVDVAEDAEDEPMPVSQTAT